MVLTTLCDRDKKENSKMHQKEKPKESEDKKVKKEEQEKQKSGREPGEKALSEVLSKDRSWLVQVAVLLLATFAACFCLPRQLGRFRHDLGAVEPVRFR